jgi:V/A-type H+-transporting ATPase subunit F
MQFYVISDNIDTQMGMRLAGIEGVVVHEEHEVIEALEYAVNNENIGIVLMTEKLVQLCDEKVFDMKLHQKRPLIVEIPDRHATSKITTAISRYVQESIGIKI